MLEVTRGQVDNENNNIQTCQINTKLRVLYTESESLAIRMGISEMRDWSTARQ